MICFVTSTHDNLPFFFFAKLLGNLDIWNIMEIHMDMLDSNFKMYNIYAMYN